MVRDVGESLPLYLHGTHESPILPKVLLRGPLLSKLRYEELKCPRTIINLRFEPDDVSHLGGDASLVRVCHYPMQNKSNVYETQSPAVRSWLADVLRLFETPVELPILIHCKRGRDRTGVVVAVMLMVFGVPIDAIREEFLLTDDARREDLQRTFDGIKARGGIDRYFEGMLDLEAIRNQLSWTHLRSTCQQLYKDAWLAVKRKEDPQHACHSLLMACESGLKLKHDDVGMHAAKGWALVHLGRHKDAHQILTEGLGLAASIKVREDIVKMMETQMEKLRADSELCTEKSLKQFSPSEQEQSAGLSQEKSESLANSC